ncbi:hypothetical protein C6503_03905 [Candidatus Poribacteria bacterium]|nr:MAG: hypothetical protein C6503_03905 [Candidatus Poribacteria bacterium]
MRLKLIFCVLLLMLMYVGVCQVFAETPTTPKILFTSARDGNYEVYSMNPDGSEQVNLTQHRAQDLSAVWSPTGEKILFISDRGGQRDLYLMDPDGSDVRRVFKFKTKEIRRNPTWSSDGKQIAYEQANFDTRIFHIYIATLGGREAEHLVHGIDPAWSPDSTEIVCNVRSRLTFVDVRTQEQRLLLPKKAMAHQRDPSWSASGDKLAFVWNNNPLPPDHKVGIEPIPEVWLNKQTVYIINRDGTGLQQLVEEDGSEAWSPVLSPDGNEVLYTQMINDRPQIFKIDVNSGVQTQLTHVGMPRFGNFGGDWFDPAYALPVSPQPHLLTTTWGNVKKQ